MAKMKGGVAVFGSAPVRIRNGDVDFEYRQDSDFFYLTGFEEPEAVCVLAPGNPKYEYALFVRPRDKERETWNGYRAGVEGAMQDFHAEIAYTTDTLEENLPEFLYNASNLYYSLNRYPEWDHRLFTVIDKVKALHRQGIYPPTGIVDPTVILADMRLFKKPDELEVLQRAVEISAQAHINAMKMTRPMKYEYEVQAVVEYEFRSKGSMRNGYPSIVGSGPNSCILHYINNNRQMKEGDLLLIDAGAEFDYYTGDITRTFPVSGKFTPQQKDVYQLVLDVQEKGIADVRPGNNIMQVHEKTVRNLTEGMISLGLLTGSVDENIEEEHYKKYYMHRTSHWLGIDVHDAGRYKSQDSWRALEPGMVLTVEPGIYIAPDDEHEAFRSIGVRIEDDVLVTAEGPKVLSASCPKKVAELEAIVGRG